MSNNPYSYHTFLFPFLWNSNGKKDWKSFEKLLNVGTRWKEASWEDNRTPKDTDRDSWLWDYASYQYFTEAANKAIFNVGSTNIVRCFEYNIKEKPIRDNGKYKITKENETFTLTINNIRLHVYNSGVAILILELKNFDHDSIEAVNKINEYGRRINMPFLKLDGSHPICADMISMSFANDGWTSEENYVDTLHGLGKNFEGQAKKISLHYIMEPIRKLLDNDGEGNKGMLVTTKPDEADSENRYFIKPCIDDRMFVCCLVMDDKFTKKLGKYNKATKEYAYISDCDLLDIDGEPEEDTISNLLYEFCFIETWHTCRSMPMKRELLKKSVYDRWIDYGTIYAMTHHSLLCVTKDGPTIDAFLTEYIQLSILSLAQRATILTLSNRAAEVANDLEPVKNAKSSHFDDIEKLQVDYVKAQNQLLLSEVTVQEQGVEIYELIQEHLYINTNKKELDEHMDNLREVADIKNARLERRTDESRVWWNTGFVVIGLIIALLQLLNIFA